MAELISGKTLAAKLKAEAAAEAAELREKGVHARLAVVIVGRTRPAGHMWRQGEGLRRMRPAVRRHRAAGRNHRGRASGKIAALNATRRSTACWAAAAARAYPRKARHRRHLAGQGTWTASPPVNVGRMVIGECFLPCTPAGCIEMLKSTGVPIAGKDAVVIGRSNIVGKPAALLLTANNATVTLCHSKTRDLKAKCAAADIIVAAIGKAGFVTADMVKEGAVVIDVGINRNAEGKLCGDVDFAPVAEKAAYITPVPVGVGLMTRAMLMKNTVKAARLQAVVSARHMGGKPRRTAKNTCMGQIFVV
ncbi:MAG: bifunctional 5,10-methylenetetrahydrofolate dehydrogenase/5,10-methenyltetrahydrofolate cyclohydrolase [Ruthenibacterium lactatiformans]